jgi:hypothetical protein
LQYPVRPVGAVEFTTSYTSRIESGEYPSLSPVIMFLPKASFSIKNACTGFPDLLI